MNESHGWIAVAIFIVGFAAGVALTAFCMTLYNAEYFKVSVMQTRQEIFSLPNGTTWKKIKTPEEVK